MQIQPECITCLIGQMERAYRRFRPHAMSKEIVEFQKKIMRIIANLDTFYSPFYGQIAYKTLNMHLGLKDPYREIKSHYNKLVEQFVPALQNKIRNSSDPVLMAISLAILGNTIDFGTNHKINLEGDLTNFSLDKLAINDYPEFVKNLQNAKTIMIIGDNAGEIVLDRLMIATLKQNYPDKRFIYSVRGGPVINDATIEDAKEVGFLDICEVVEGADCPGVIIEQASVQFKQIYLNEADLIISKGQGNFESLDDSNGTKASIYFCLKLKCEYVASIFNYPMESLVFCNRNRFIKND